MGDLSFVSDAAPSDRIDAAGYLLGIGAWSDTTVGGTEALAGSRTGWSPPPSTHPNT